MLPDGGGTELIKSKKKKGVDDEIVCVILGFILSMESITQHSTVKLQKALLVQLCFALKLKDSQNLSEITFLKEMYNRAEIIEH